MDGLLITHGGKRYFVRPELLELCQVSDADLAEVEKGHGLSTEPVVALAASERELSAEQLAGVAGGSKIPSLAAETVMCPHIF